LRVKIAIGDEALTVPPAVYWVKSDAASMLERPNSVA
jgi:hypothetical protein